MNLKYQIKKANKILDICKKIKTRKETVNIDIDFYKNGRERGYHLNNYENNNVVSFAEFRNSDNIVVYFGKSKEFDMNNIPNEHVYQNQYKMFKYNQEKETSEFIMNFLLNK